MEAPDRAGGGIMKRARRPPAWCVAGARVDYHALINGPVTTPGCMITDGPSLLGWRTWVVWLDKVCGCVAVDALSIEGQS